MATDLPPRVNYIFVDFENVHETDLDRIAQKPVKVILVLGGQQKSLPVSLVKKLLQYASQVQLVETGRTGKNASDLVLAHYIGEVKKSDPHGYIHILSKDKDFDALIGHYKLNGSLAARHASFSEIPVLMNVAERAQLLAGFFMAEHAPRPSKRKTLESHMQAVFGKTLTPEEVEATVKKLVANRIITLAETGDISYFSHTAPTAPAKPRTTTPAPKPVPPPTSAKSPAPAPKPKAPVKAKAQLTSLAELVTYALTHLREHPKSRPTRKDALVRHLLTLFGNQHTEAKVLAITEHLWLSGLVIINDKGVVTYRL